MHPMPASKKAAKKTSKKASKKATKKPAPAKPAVKIDPKLKSRYDKLLAEIDDARRDEASQFDRLYEAVGEILESEPALWPLGGYASLAEWCDAELKSPLRTVQRNVRVAKYASPAQIDKLGSTLLDAALGYIEAKVGVVKGKLPVDFDHLKVPVKRDGGTKNVPLADATVDEVKAATKALHADQRRGQGKSRSGDALAKAMSKHAALTDVDARVSNGMVSFSRIPLASLDLFARTLIATKLPRDES